MKKISAGLLMYRIRGGHVEVLLVHLGGPFWAKKDEGAWFLPKGEVEEGEDLLTAAKREFQEETGLVAQADDFLPLGCVQHKRGKVVHAWAFKGDSDPGLITSNTFTIEWPPRSGKQQTFPEVDRAAFFSIDEAMRKIFADESEFVRRIETICKQMGLVQINEDIGVGEFPEDESGQLKLFE